jgi:hypothetical protein
MSKQEFRQIYFYGFKLGRTAAVSYTMGTGDSFLGDKAAGA